MKLSNAEIIFNYDLSQSRPSDRIFIVNLLILLGKWSIHKYWVTDCKIPVNVILKNEIILRYKIEKELRPDSVHLEEIRKIVNVM